MQERRCIGYIRESDETIQPCVNNQKLANTGKSQCEACETKENRSRCIMCRGESCINPTRLKYCSQPHALYITAFYPDLVKVGIAFFDRRKTRIDRQGAPLAWFVAKGDGKAIRKLEHRISAMGIKDKVPNNFKAKYLLKAADTNKLRNLLKNIYRDIETGLNNFNCISIEPHEEYLSTAFKMSDRENINLYSCKIETIGNESLLIGDVVAARGSLMALESDKILKVYNLNNLKGWIIDINYQGQLPNGQMGLF